MAAKEEEDFSKDAVNNPYLLYHTLLPLNLYTYTHQEPHS